MPRYEFSEGTSNKFWEIVLSGKSFTTTFGKIGTDGQSSTKTFKTEAEAKKEYAKLIAEKTKKGYELAAAADADEDEEDAEDADDVDDVDDDDDDLDEDFDDEGDAEPDDLLVGDDDDEPKPAAKPGPKAVGKPAAKSIGGGGGGGGRGGARYFELVEGGSAKFWEINLLGDSFTTRYGKIGTDGQKTVKEYDSPAQAKKEFEKLVAEKTKKGYQEKKGGGSTKPTAKAALTRAAKPVVIDDDEEEEEEDE